MTDVKELDAVSITSPLSGSFTVAVSGFQTIILPIPAGPAPPPDVLASKSTNSNLFKVGDTVEWRIPDLKRQGDRIPVMQIAPPPRSPGIKMMTFQLPRYAGCLAYRNDGSVLVARKAFGPKYITNVGGGKLEEKEEYEVAAIRELKEETFGLASEHVFSPKCQERFGAQMYSRLYHVKINDIDTKVLDLEASRYIERLQKLKAELKACEDKINEDDKRPLVYPPPLSEHAGDWHSINEKITKCKRYTEFDKFFWVSCDVLMSLANQYYRASDRGKKPATPIKMFKSVKGEESAVEKFTVEKLGELEPSFCCLLCAELIEKKDLD